jgi:hypothetical protein
MPHIGGIKQYFHEPDQYNHAHAEKSAHFMPSLHRLLTNCLLARCCQSLDRIIFLPSKDEIGLLQYKNL